MRTAPPCPLLLPLLLALAGGCGSSPGDPDSERQGPAQEVEPEAVPVTVSGGQLILPAPVVFVGTGQTTIHPDSEQGLLMVKLWLDREPQVTLLRIEVHSDNTSSPAECQALSEQRALVVSKRLVEFGVDCKRFLPTGFGSTKPLADPTTPDGRSKNRRVEFRPAAMRGKAIGAMPLDGGGKVAGDPCAK